MHREAFTDATESAQDGAGSVARVGRILQICNACRSCDDFCPVFPAMTRRLASDKAGIHYLANLCHNCGACLHACHYAPPHELALNVPRAMARVRLETYSEYAWPRGLGALYKRSGLTLSVALAMGLALFLMLAAAKNGSLWGTREGSFYSIFPHKLIISLFAPIFLFAATALGIGVTRFWRQGRPGPTSRAAVGEATRDALSLKYLDGADGYGCDNADGRLAQRRRFHHLTFYGFLLCLAATGVATLYHYLFKLPAPYDYASLPKLLGISGGIALLIGTSGLFWLNVRREPLQQDLAQRPMDRGFIALLFAVAASGLALMLFKHAAALPVVVCLHLGTVMALFATLPYGKFAHGIYRSAALLKWSVERRQPSKLKRLIWHF